MGTWPRITLTTFPSLLVPRYNQVTKEGPAAAFCNVLNDTSSGSSALFPHPFLHCAAWIRNVTAGGLATIWNYEEKIMPKRWHSCEWEGVYLTQRGHANHGPSPTRLSVQEEQTSYFSHTVTLSVCFSELT